MKKIFLYIAITLGLLSCNHKDSLWQEVVEDLDERVETLEMLCAEMNTNITSLQTIVDVLQSNDFITSIVEIKKDGKVVGYTITFGKHDPITIYHGQDGKDGQNGQNGADGKDGITPVIGVAQDTDGVYYWTLNGEWLLDDNGNKLPVSGEDGKDGANGADGKDGQDGTDGKDGQDGEDGKDGVDGQDGKDGITPQLKIEDGYWFISYDNGATWTQLGKATGEDGKDGVDGADGKDGADGADGKDGQNGADGKDGQDGDSMFQSVTQDENYVYFTLADGTVIKIAKASEEEQPNSEFMFVVTYDANGGEGVMQKDTFYYGVLKPLSNNTYTKSPYEFINWNTKADGSGIAYEEGQKLMISKNINLYAQWGTKPIFGIEENYEWVDLGLSVKWATMNVGASKPEEVGLYFAWGEVEAKESYSWNNYKWCQDGSSSKITKYNTNSYLGTLDYKTQLDLEDDAAHVNWGGNWRMPTKQEFSELKTECTWKWSSQNGVWGFLVSASNGKSIFLPTTGFHNAYGIDHTDDQGDYWTSTLFAPTSSYYIIFSYNSSSIGNRDRFFGQTVRPVCP